ncbi:MAG TPA: nucleotidyltransferase family protein, partial [Telmatospirillum sp.]|nr:nucleotidyltransferase family protein [Telmatospirillum sp.]
MINPDGFRLLCLLARWPQSPAERLALQQAIDGCRDWDVILRAASRHHIIPLIYKTLTEAGSVTVPDRTMSALRHKSRIGIGRALRIAAHTGTMISALDKAGIQSLALKGAALSCQLYGDLISRGAGDIDLLVDSETLWNADAVLRDIGYRRSAGDLPPQRRAAYARWLKDLHYARDGWPMIELHHRLTNNRHLLPRDFTTLWSRREIIQVGPLDIPTLARRD